MINFYELNESEVLNNPALAPGSFICCKDSSNIYMIPTTGGNPVRLAETTKFITESERSNMLAPINSKKYFCYDTGKMWIYYNEWICINQSINIVQSSGTSETSVMSQKAVTELVRDIELTPGPTPVKGVDYWTEADKTEIVNDVLEAMPMFEEASF